MIKKEEPIISVIIPVYNMEKYLKRCLDSVINQTYKNLEIILVNDGSQDISGMICDEYAEQDDRIVVIHKENAGVSAARNTGLDCATGEYVAFVDSDDYIMPDMYWGLYNCIKEKKVDIAVCQWQYEQKNGHQVVKKENINRVVYGEHTFIEFERLLSLGGYENGIVCSPWNKLFPKKAFDNVRFYGDICDDEEMNDRIIAQGYSYFVLEDFYYIYCQNDQSITNQKFSKKRLHVLDVIHNRIWLFKEDEKIVLDSKKLYCNIYIEYYFKAQDAKIEFPENYTVWFEEIVSNLRSNKSCNFKFFLRMQIFEFWPKLYRIITKM